MLFSGFNVYPSSDMRISLSLAYTCVSNCLQCIYYVRYLLVLWGTNRVFNLANMDWKASWRRSASGALTLGKDMLLNLQTSDGAWTRVGTSHLKRSLIRLENVLIIKTPLKILVRLFLEAKFITFVKLFIINFNWKLHVW